MKKFELTSETKIVSGKTLYRIRALIDFGSIKAGDLGGWIEIENNLSQDGDAWVSGNARVYDNAYVSGNARVFGDARVSGDACVYGNARVSGNAWVYGNARVSGNAWVYGDARVSGDAWVNSNDAFMLVSNIGSRNDTTTFFLGESKEILVNCGCFHGTIEQFADRVDRVHGDNIHGKMYRMAIEMAKIKFAKGNEK